ncbi:metal ABC transporter solute-binding protein, Zn/Mn family [Microbacterium suwonense]|uniref:Metal ABC transporter substrate-binding protein n=1 Tax=Microbacterium suwonense TaxID=683047 RepID=A0ABM8FWF9_9MICO|nr:zinc ABC transporter substrate-binding protein [Microbacterium suwonense]BDZ40073.1 metal ABC transporter substrate-binding protein [Microbacterium suwonense]
MRKILAPVALAAASVLVLTGCGASTAPADDGRIRIVASTNVWGDIVRSVGGDHVEVTSIIDSLSQDPHEYEATAADQLKVKNAQLIVANGGGYDSFIDSLEEAVGGDPVVITAVEFSHDYPGDDHDEHDHDHDEADDHEGHDHIEGFNEHVWYDVHTVGHVAEQVAKQLGELDAANKADYEKNLAAFQDDLEGLETSLAEIESAHGGEKIFVTEPVPLHLTAAAGLVDVTPSEFSEAVEEGQDVPPAVLLEARKLLEAGDVAVLLANAQTGGAETTQVIDVAESHGIPVQEVTELLPDGDDYISWMTGNIATLAGNLDK